MVKNGSNACFFIPLNFGQIYKQSEPFYIQEQQLNSEWQEAIKEAIIMQNDMHDVLYDQQGVNVTSEAHSGQTQKSNATSGFHRLELRKSLK